MEATGARVALAAQFPNLTFILDRPHLKQHFYEGAEAIGLTGVERHKWVSDLLHLVDAGDVRKVIRTFKKYRGQEKKRIASLNEHLQRFVDAVDYDYFRAIGLPIGSGEVESAITVYSSKASYDSGGNMASRYHKPHAGAAHYSSQWLVGGFLDETICFCAQLCSRLTR